MKKFLKKLQNYENLNFEESKNAFEILMEGKALDQEIFDFLTLLSAKGEVSEEIAGGVHVLRNKSKRVNVLDCVDTCGTGGDGKNTLNISTASAILLASMGVKVAKHGNKAVSSKCGSGDVLETLNININLEPKQIEDQINKNNFGFMFAPNYHRAMKYVGPTRKKIAKRTIFNMIGPLSSPALVDKQVVGVFDKKLLKIFANALKNLNIKFAWIVNSEDGLDEISPYAKTNVVQLKEDKITEITIDPIDLNIDAQNFKNLLGDDAKFNADKIITPSKYFRDLVSKWTSGRTQVEHIYNGIELPKDLPARAKARDNLKISQEKKIIVSAGRLVPWKGFFGLTNVVEKISKEYPSIHLYILGDGPDREKLQKKIEELEIERYVTLTGSQSRSDMFQYLVSADIFVLNTSFESFSFQVVEAMHAGVPVITTNIGSLPELVTHDKQGFLVVPDDSSRLESYIKKILDHQADVTSLGEEAKKKAQEFSIERTVNELVSKMSYENN